MTPTEPVKRIHVRPLLGWSPRPPDISVSTGLAICGWLLGALYFIARSAN